MNLYSVKDNVSGAFYPPEMYEKDELIIRVYKNYVNSGKKDTLLATNPGDFTIYKIGTFDYQKTGKVTAIELEFVCNLNDLVEVPHGEA